MTTVCPSCGYARQPTDLAPDYECPKCGIVYAKYKTKEEREAEEIRKNLERIRIEREQAELADRIKQEAAERETVAEQVRSEEAKRKTERRRRKLEVVVTDVRIPFESMVWLLFKWSLAAIPALALLTACAFFIGGIFGFLFH